MIFSMWRKRGRPKKSSSEGPVITPELLKKHRLGLTQEALDICFERSLISKNQQSCGIRLRWLYTLIYGAVTVQSKMSNIESFCGKKHTEQWLKKRQEEYFLIARKLQADNVFSIVSDICIYNNPPSFLQRRNIREQSDFIDGMRELEALMFNKR